MKRTGGEEAGDVTQLSTTLSGDVRKRAERIEGDVGGAGMWSPPVP